MRTPLPVFLMALVFTALTATAAARPLVFAVAPYKKPSEIYVMFSPLVRYLEKGLHREIDIVVGKSYLDIIDRYKTGEIDIGYLDPVSYIKAHRQAGVLPLLSMQEAAGADRRAVIVVRADSIINSISQLRGKRVAFGDINSGLTHYLPHYMMLNSNVSVHELADFKYVGSNENIALNVINANFDAGGMEAKEAMPYLDQGLKILAESEVFAPHLFVVGNNFNRTLKQRLKSLMEKADLRFLRNINPQTTGLRAAEDREFDGVRNIVNVVNYRDPPQ